MLAGAEDSCCVMRVYSVGPRPGSQIRTIGLDGGQVTNCDGVMKELFPFSETLVADLFDSPSRCLTQAKPYETVAETRKKMTLSGPKASPLHHG